MKKVLLLALMASTILIISCNTNQSLAEPEGVLVKISNDYFLGIQISCLKICCESARIDSETREIIITNPNTLGYNMIGNRWGKKLWISKVSIRESCLILSLPKNFYWRISIDDKRYVLPKTE